MALPVVLEGRRGGEGAPGAVDDDGEGGGMERLAREHEAGAVGIGQGVRDEAQKEGFVESVDLVAHDGEAKREERGANLVGASRPRARRMWSKVLPQ